ncbi:MAG: ATP-dependent sacrificial sulfur transferase LarE [Methanomicrobiales archaeon]|nr:ATP-dependent sacrificial sulfur transferase LarE [Methanomicrobiales archaeon]
MKLLQDISSVTLAGFMDVNGKEELLMAKVGERGSMLIAYSGGVDSSLLAGIAREVLGDRCRAVLLESPVVSRVAIRQAEETAGMLGIPLDVIPVPLMEETAFLANPANRCYYCKKVSARALKGRAKELGLACVADGMNCSDLGGHRPGIRASDEEGIVHPFLETGMTKEDIRAIARGRGYPFWNKPSAACLVSRIPYGEEITRRKLRMIEDAEEYLLCLGFTQVRVRLHGGIARIEVIPEEMEKLLQERDVILNTFRSIGFRYVTVDLGGYRTGSMDEVL